MRFGHFALLSSLALGAPLPALAEQADTAETASVEAARDEFRRASALAQAERWAEALELYVSAYRRVPRATTLYNIGFCREKLGDFAAAYRDTFAALELSKQDSARGLSPEHRIQAETALLSLKTQVARLEFPPNAEAVAVLVDGAPVTALGAGAERLFFVDAAGSDSNAPLAGGGALILDPGRRRVEVKSTRGIAAVDLDLSANTSSTFTWPTFEPPRESAPPAPETQPPPRPSITLAPPRPGPPERPLRPWAIGSLALGGTALALGTGAGLMALSAKGDLDHACSSDGDCPEAQSDTVSRFETSATVANIAFAVAAVSGAAGVTLLLLDTPTPASGKLELRVTTAGRVELGGRF
jgi:hypothetical protein